MHQLPAYVADEEVCTILIGFCRPSGWAGLRNAEGVIIVRVQPAHFAERAKAEMTERARHLAPRGKDWSYDVDPVG